MRSAAETAPEPDTGAPPWITLNHRVSWIAVSAMATEGYWDVSTLKPARSRDTGAAAPLTGTVRTATLMIVVGVPPGAA